MKYSKDNKFNNIFRTLGKAIFYYSNTHCHLDTFMNMSQKLEIHGLKICDIRCPD